MVKSNNQGDEINNDDLIIDSETNDHDKRISNGDIISPIKHRRNRGGKNKFKNRRSSSTVHLLQIMTHVVKIL